MAEDSAVAKKKSTPKSGSETRRFDALMRMSTEVRDKAKKLAALEGGSAAEIVADIVLPVLDKRLQAAYRKGLGSDK